MVTSELYILQLEQVERGGNGGAVLGTIYSANTTRKKKATGQSDESQAGYAEPQATAMQQTQRARHVRSFSITPCPFSTTP